MLLLTNGANGPTSPRTELRRLDKVSRAGRPSSIILAVDQIIAELTPGRLGPTPPGVPGEAPVGPQEGTEPRPVPSQAARPWETPRGGQGEGTRRPGPETVLSLGFLGDVYGMG